MSSPHRCIAIAVRVYTLALYVCPRDLREQYATDMRFAFEARCADAAGSGCVAVAAATVREIADLAIASLRADRRFRTRQAHRPERRWFVRLFAGLWQDAGYGARTLRRQPGFAVVATLTLALGIGATTAVFTVVDGVVLRPLPYGHPDRIVAVTWGRPGRLTPWLSPLNFLDLTTQSQAFAGAAAYSPVFSNLTGLGDPERVEGASVMWNFFDVLEANATAAFRGRAFLADDVKRPEANVMVLSDRLWRRTFGGRLDAVGATVRLDGKPFTIVGVAPPDVDLPRGAEFWQPLIFSPDDVAPRSRGAQWVVAIARLKTGTTVPQANSALATVAARLAADFPNTNAGSTAQATPLGEHIIRNIRPTLLMLMGAVAFVLLIACVNVANLLLARAHARQREVAVRAALGAGRRRLVQQFLWESLLLGALGSGCGLLVAFGSVQAVKASGPADIPRLAEVTVDLRVLAFTIAISIGTSIVFGLAPALLSTSGVAAPIVAGGGARGVVGGGARTRKALVICEMALAVVLLVGAGLLMRSYYQLQHVDPGFQPDKVLTASLSFPSAKYPQLSDRGRFTTTLVEHLVSAPGVQAAAVAFGAPFSNGFNAHSSFTRRGEADSADTPSAGMRIVTPEYFRLLGIPLRAGRTFNAHDDEAAAEVVIINQEAARRFWPNRDPIGDEIHVGVNLTSGERSGQKTIVGIVGDVKYGGLDADAQPELYLPYAQHRVDGYTVLLRSSGDPLSLAPVLRRELAALDRELPVADLEPMPALIGSSLAERRFTTLLLATFAAVALALAVIGIYGVLAYMVGQRTQEIGVRLAIGASPRDVVRLVVREGMVLAAIGLAGGAAGAIAATRALGSLLFGVTPIDPMTFAGAAVALAGGAFVASYAPARRAAKVDPMQALRAD